MHNPFVAVFIAALAAWIFGAVWYGLLGRRWMAAQGMGAAEIEAKCEKRRMPIVPMMVSFVSELVMAFVLSLILPVGKMNWEWGAAAGFAIGVSFMLTTTLVNNMFQQRKLMLSVIDGTHWTLVAAIEGAVLASLI